MHVTFFFFFEAGPLIQKRDLPTVMELCMLNTVVAKAQAYADFNSKMTSPDSDSLK